ncbi:MAG: hypothetical protein PCFJNLEI_01486 [Verrucomicrobiae bacterium]|nr:hypothetical protein [Verrucomicrobiae bacterium]
MQNEAAVAIVYGLLVLAGGLLGYRKARSAPSLVAGLVFGLALIACGFYMWHGDRIGLKVAFGLAVALLVVMGIRFAKGRKFMPAGLVTVLSLVAAVVFGLALGK